jgi:hypothetical protein
VVADAVPDTRNQLFVLHSYRTMVTARMMAIAAGYEDADDLDALRFDPALMLACEREPENGHGIPSQPTISRLENVADALTLYKIGIGYIDFFCRSYEKPPTSIVAIASSQSTSSRATPTSRSCRSCGPASDLRARRSHACSGTSSAASAGTGRM